MKSSSERPKPITPEGLAVLLSLLPYVQNAPNERSRKPLHRIWEGLFELTYVGVVPLAAMLIIALLQLLFHC